jgi:hypothetical protein
MDPEQHRRWSESRAHLRDARASMRAGQLDDALAAYTHAHDLGDDNVICHARGHWGRARVELRQRMIHDASIDAFFAIVAILVSPLRRLRGVRGPGFAK